VRVQGNRRQRKTAAATLYARLNEDVTLEANADGNVAACLDGHVLERTKLGASAAKRALALRTGLSVRSLASPRSAIDKEVELLVRRLARRGLLEYGLSRARGGGDLVAIEPQIEDYWPQTAKLGANDTVALSRFAYLRRRGTDLVLESPRAPALFRINDPKTVAAIMSLSRPQRIADLRRQRGFVGPELLGLLLDCNIIFKVAAGSEGLRSSEGDANLVVWDFHDLLFHARSTEGRHANPMGGRYAFVGVIPPPPAVRPRLAGGEIDLQQFTASFAEPISHFTALLRERHSTRDFDADRPITIAELAKFLHHAARVQWKWTTPLDFGDGSFGLEIDYTRRPYPSAGASYELELYLAVANCEGLEKGFYHYDADRHALVSIKVRPQELARLLASAQFAMDAAAPPQILITIAARFNRVSWKYSAIAYSLILKDVGVLLQTLYLTATDLDLGGCAIGTGNIDLLSKMTGQEFHVEGPVGQFALGRAAKVGGAG
jgi:SagB-type dehydrogenase family enzyme